MRLHLLALSLVGSTGVATAQQQQPSSTQPSAPAPSTSPATPARDTGTIPWIIGIQQGFTRDDNLFRAPDGDSRKVADTYSSTGLRVGIDQPFGRQNLSLDALAQHNRYRSNKQLNNTSYEAGARLDWATVERLSGDVAIRQRQGLYRETTEGIITSDRNQLRTTSASAQARVGLVTRWSFEAGVAGSENEYTGRTVTNRDMRQHGFNAGVRFQPSAATTARLAYRQSDGEYPRLTSSSGGSTTTTGPDEFTRRDIDLIGNFTPSGASSLNVRVSSTREDHTSSTRRDTSGWTGALGWVWRPTGKLVVDLDLSRDTSIGRSGLETSLISAAESSDATLTQGGTLRVTWNATAKIRVVPRVGYVYRKLDNAFLSTSADPATGNDKTTVASLALRYQPISALDIGCDYSHEKRKTEGGLSTPYKAGVVGCSAEFAFR